MAKIEYLKNNGIIVFSQQYLKEPVPVRSFQLYMIPEPISLGYMIYNQTQFQRMAQLLVRLNKCLLIWFV